MSRISFSFQPSALQVGKPNTHSLEGVFCFFTDRLALLYFVTSFFPCAFPVTLVSCLSIVNEFLSNSHSTFCHLLSIQFSKTHFMEGVLLSSEGPQCV